MSDRGIRNEMPGLRKRMALAVQGRARRLRNRLADGSRPLRLNVGCGSQHLDGYINVDIDSRNHPDVLADVRELEQHFSAESVEEILALHMVGYLRMWEARDFFKAAYRVLTPGGRLVIETCDLEKVARRIVEGSESLDDYLENVRAIYMFAQDWNERRVPYTPAHFGWSGRHLAQELEVAGFGTVR